MAWLGDLLCARGDGASHPVCPYCRHHPASHRSLHATVRPAVDRPFRWVPLGQALPHPRQRHEVYAGFDGLLKASGVEPIVLPPRSPNLNAHCERFVRSLKEEALAQMVLLGERSLYYAIDQYLTHYHTERNHQGLDNQLIAPDANLRCHRGQISRRERLGGLLRYYYRDAA
jgi:transposase InsO family protein